MTTATKIGRRLAKRQDAQGLVLTRTLDDYFTSDPDPVFDPEVVEIMSDVLLGNRRDDRNGRFGPSGRDTCLRRQMFSFLGVKQAITEGGLAWVFAEGTEKHIMLQLVLLQTKLVYDIEVRVAWGPWRSHGRTDGLGYSEQLDKHYGVDIKTTSALEHQIRETETRILAYLANRIPRPEKRDWLWQHMWKAWLQAHTYMLLSDMDPNIDSLDFFVLLYLHKGSGAHIPFREVVVERHPVAMEIVEKEIEALNDFVAAETLPDMLDGCYHRPESDKVFEKCPYRQSCETATWPGRLQVVQPVAVPRRRRVIKIPV